MRSVWVCAAAPCALAWGAPGQAAPRPSIVTNPDWLERPSGEDVAASYPRVAEAKIAASAEQARKHFCETRQCEAAS